MEISKFPETLRELSMRKQYVPGSFLSAHAQEPGNEASMANAFGRSSMCNKSESKVSLYGKKEFEDLLVWSFLKMAMHALSFHPPVHTFH